MFGRFLVIFVITIAAGTMRMARHVNWNEMSKSEKSCATAVAWWNKSVGRGNAVNSLFGEVDFDGSQSDLATAEVIYPTMVALQETQEAVRVPTKDAPAHTAIVANIEYTVGYVGTYVAGGWVNVNHMMREGIDVDRAVDVEQANIKALCN
jgi:hypothetical protein